MDPYELLQVPTSASADELRGAFRRLSKQVHPDTTTLPAAEAEEAFRQLRQAYTLLSDPARRRAYDAQRQGPTAAPRPPVIGMPRPTSVRRALSGGEWFALVLLALALALSLVLGIGVAWARGAELIRQPSWWEQQRSGPPPPAPAADAATPPATPSLSCPDGSPARCLDPALQPPPAGPGAMAA